ncbi:MULTISPECIES: NAD(P)-dependent oxidoreductase [unclassified Streptomyces]|uniref:NAD(P)-dependent oxidoreductase n=1 Tax=unclassified Streptomyces TaxID=2593676 RepID=UPI002476F833|nr:MULTISPECIES: NAD(P)-dependent oxidoreductase [unclassified Streptomyces]MDH6453702.1 3-hydroxyisobutyrate dehydrogenase-like beta-hydroxyacid dehydrogenase [Streptomyces sp. SAI-119]MDH6495740.1 3-hydroxyisobutyrate dehydrogenase-like beta-hydroxyacid dehydrogenase [Streptomyces sp. SAI-149]
MSSRTTAFIGLGAMGAGMAHSLLDAGFDVAVHNRTASRAAPLAEAGAHVAASAARAAADRDTVVLSLSDETAVEEVLFGQVLPVLRQGATVVDTSTVSPRYARACARRLAAAGVRRVEACVVGNPLQARQGALRVFAAGEEQDIEGVRDLLEAIGTEVVTVGAPGTAATVKLVLNLLLGAQVASLAEAVAYGVRAGLDRDQLLASVAGSGFSSAVLRFRAELMRKDSYEPAFFRSALMEKDLRLAVSDGAGLGVPMPVLETVRSRFEDVVRAGDGDKDAAVVVRHTGR